MPSPLSKTLINSDATKTGSASSYTWSALSFGAAADDRIIVCGFSHEDASGNGAGQLSSVTIGGVTADFFEQDDTAGGVNSCIAWAVVPTGTSGDVVATWTTGRIGCHLTWWRLTGYDPTAFDTAGDTVDPVSTTIDVAFGGCVIGKGNCGTSTTAVTTTGLTEDADVSFDGNRACAGSISHLPAQTGRTVGFNGAGNSSGAFVSFKPIYDIEPRVLAATTKNVSTTDITSSSFTPTANALLTAHHIHLSGVLDLTVPAISDTAGLTWTPVIDTQDEFFNPVNSEAVLVSWWAVAPSSPSSMTVTVNPTGTPDHGACLAVLEWPGADIASPIGVSAENAHGNDTGSLTLSGAPADTSVVVHVVANYNIGTPSSVSVLAATDCVEAVNILAADAQSNLGVQVRFSDTSTAIAWGDAAVAANIDADDLLVTHAFEIKIAGGGAYTLTVGHGSFALAGQAVATKRNWLVDVAQGSFALSGQAATLRKGHPLAIGQGTYAISGQDVSLKRGRRLDAAQGAYALTGQAVSLERGFPIAVGHGTFALSGQDVTFPYNQVLTVGHGVFPLSGQDVAGERGRLLAVGHGAFSLTGQAITLARGKFVAIAHGTFALTGQAVALEYGRNVLASFGSFALSGQDVALKRSRRMDFGHGAYALTGQAITLAKGRFVAIGQGSFALSGQAISLRFGRVVGVAQGGFTLSGQAVTFPRTRIFSVGHGVFALSGQIVALLFGRKLGIGQGSFSLAGQNVDLVEAAAGAFTIGVGVGSFSLSGQAVALLRTRLMGTAHGSVALSGQAINTEQGYRISADHGAFALTGNDVSLERGRLVAIGAGAFSLAGQNVSLNGGRKIAVNQGAYALTGRDVAFPRARVLDVDHGAYALDGRDVTLSFGVVATFTLNIGTGAFLVRGQDLHVYRMTLGELETSRRTAVADPYRIATAAPVNRVAVAAPHREAN